ncbi:LPS assembly lipoprotein LptE [Salipiger sp.]|uniref:LPS assembly lipoprotein LptE n=1 Tax=Salipiger sp. TaxID=2078585 RepID=UPI003A96B5CC
MWSPDRRLFLASFAALGGCGFTPAYGPQGGGGALLNSVALAEPDTTDQYAFNRRFEDRMGRGSGPYVLTTRIETNEQGLGSLADGSTTRVRLLGRVFYTLRDPDGATLVTGRTNAFTGYSITGSTPATEAAQRDAQDRLMILLADQVIDRLLLDADKLTR